MDTSALIRTIVDIIPTVRPHLTGKALAFVFNLDSEYKTESFFRGTVEHLVKQVYGGYMSGEFSDIMDNLISGQIADAYQQAWEDDGNTEALPIYLLEAEQAFVTDQWKYVEGFYRAIVDARVDGTPIEPLLERAQMWAGQWTTAYESATLAIHTQTGGRGQWIKGQTELGCRICDQLDGIVAYFSEWEQLGVHPRGFPNPLLGCGGGGPSNNCDCEIKQTDQRRSPNAFQKISSIVGI